MFFIFLLIALIVFLVLRSKDKDSNEVSSKRESRGASFESEFKGAIGESKVRLVIDRLGLEGEFVINNLVLNVDGNKTSQIDHVLINHNGIFVIETKNYSGRIYGNEDQLQWTQVLNYGKVKNKFYNPVKQNKTHIYYISKILTDKLPIVSAVVFVEGNIDFIEAQGVYTLRGLQQLIKEPHGQLTDEQMRKAYTELMNANNTSVSNSEHIRNIHSMQSDISNNICPRCGKKLVLRKGSYGEFYGCSGYPNCKFIKKN